MKINFTKKQYRDLIKLAYLGNWYANAIRVGNKQEPNIKRYHGMEQYIFSYTDKFDSSDLVEWMEEYSEYFPTRKLEDDPEIVRIMEEFDEENFWDSLHSKLYARDFLRQYPPAIIRKMSFRERITKEEPYSQKWYDELEKNGLNRFEIKE